VTISTLLSIVTVAAFDNKRLEKTLLSMVSLPPSVEHLLVIPENDEEGIELWKARRNLTPSKTKIVYDQNRGIYSAMNLGANVASGKYLSFWNAGDNLASCSELELLLEKLAILDPVWLVHQGIFEWRPKQELSRMNVRNFVTHHPNAFISHQTVIVKSKTFHELGGFNLNYQVAADTDQITKLYNSSEPVFEDLVVIEIETPNFASKNHRKARMEVIKIALRELSGKDRYRALSNILRMETVRFKRKFK